MLGNNSSIGNIGIRRKRPAHDDTAAEILLIQILFEGGFDGTSNVLAGKLYGIPVRGTHAHAFVTSFTGLEDLNSNSLTPAEGK